MLLSMACSAFCLVEPWMVFLGSIWPTVNWVLWYQSIINREDALQTCLRAKLIEAFFHRGSLFPDVPGCEKRLTNQHTACCRRHESWQKSKFCLEALGFSGEIQVVVRLTGINHMAVEIGLCVALEQI